MSPGIFDLHSARAEVRSIEYNEIGSFLLPFCFMSKERAVSPSSGENRFIHQRLRAVYRFADRAITSVRYPDTIENHLDVGTYKGTFLTELLRFAKNVYSFDLDLEKLQAAKEREDLGPAFEDNRIHLGQMMAQNVGFSSDTFDSATIVEVFGAGFTGTEEDVAQVIREVHRVLKPGGILVMSVRSKSAEEVFDAVAHLDNKGLAVSRKSLKSILYELFGNDVHWYGQAVLRHNERDTTFLTDGPYYGLSLPVSVQRDEAHIGHVIWDKNAFDPKPIPDLTKETPGYWVGVFRKEEESR